jgi:hypothetical protein
MKKLIAIIMALALALCLLTACGGKDKDSGSEGGGDLDITIGGPSDEDIPDVDFGAIMAGNGGGVIYGHLSAADRQAIIDAGKAEGIEVTFLPDGSTKFVNTDNGAIIIQNPDGTWVIEDEEGNKGQIGGDWPDNDFTKLVPKPDFGLNAAVESDQSFAVVFTDATLDQIKAYVEVVKGAGFTVDAETEDMEAGGMEIYNYTARNAAGYAISVFSMSGTAGLSIEKP